MTEEKKEKEEAKAKAVKPPAEKHPAPKLVVDKPHHLKISHMGLNDLNEAIEVTRQKMGGLHSQYAQFLVARRDFLMKQSHATPMRKAA